MQGVKGSIKSYFSFSKKELNGIFLLCLLIITVLVIPWFYKRYNKSPNYDFNKFKIEVKSFQKTLKVISQKEERTKVLHVQYFQFDPNLISDEQWEKLGLTEKQIKVIRNYLTKGGKFYKKEDLKRIYSIAEPQYLLLEPYVQIDKPKFEPINQENKKTFKFEKYNEKTQVPVIELNSADSVALLKIRGIGPSFASRIIRFRNRLGGFYKLDQLREVYGIDSIKFSQIKAQLTLNPNLVQKINVNTATFNQFKVQPYLSYKQINALIQFRSQHGDFKSIDDLKKIVVLNEEIIRKIEPYFIF